MKRKAIFLAAALCCYTFSGKAQVNFMDYFTNPTWHECDTGMESAIVLNLDKTAPGVSYAHNVVYTESFGHELTLQILSPERREAPYPAIVFIQGSAWMQQNVYANIPALSRFAAKGYVVAIVEYTHSGIAPFPAPLQDVKQAIRYMRKNAERLGIDPENVFVWGDSSGGHLSLMTALTEGLFEKDEDADIPTTVNACVAYYPVTDIISIHRDPCSASTGKEDSPEGMLLGGVDVEEHPEESAAASPVSYVSKDREIPPIMIAVGTCDHIVPFSQSELMARTLSDAGKEYVHYVLKGADHGSWEFWTDEMFSRVDSFLQEHLK